MTNGNKTISAWPLALIRPFCLFLVTAWAFFVIPGLVLAGLSYAKLGFFAPRLDFPAAEHWAVLWSLGPALALDSPLIELDFAAGLPLSQSYVLTPLQIGLSMTLASIIAACLCREHAGAGLTTALMGLALVIAALPGLLGHCAQGAAPGGVLSAMGADADTASAAAAVSPYLQIGFIALLTVRLFGLPSFSRRHNRQVNA